MDGSASAFDFMKEQLEASGKPVTRFDELFSFLDRKAMISGTPLQGQFELTPLCNFNCGMCYAHLTPEQLAGQSVLPVSVWKDLIRQAWEAGMMAATLTGGECLAYPGFDELYLYLHSLGCETAVLTNGFLLDDERIRFFLKHRPTSIQVTMYGCSDDVYERVTGRRAFRTVVDNIQKALDADLPVIVSITPSACLGEDVFETIKAAKSLCKAVLVNSNLFAPREETGRSGQRQEPDLDMYIRIYRYLNELEGRDSIPIPADQLPPAGGPYRECAECGLECSGGRSHFSIDWHGTMMPCYRLGKIRAYPLKEGFRPAWKKINEAANKWPRVAECIECPYEKMCNNCAANMQRFVEAGVPPTDLCRETVALVQSGARHLPNCE